MTSNQPSLTMMSSSPSQVPPISTATVTISTTASPQSVVMKGKRYRQRPLGPAPFASFEDLSDELDSPPETARVHLPGIKEDPASQIQTPLSPHPLTPGLTVKEQQGLKEALTSQLQTPATPRIDISRASSSSQHEDSITSSPEREGASQTLGFKEDGTQELRSSTEELDYIQEPGTVEESEAKRRREKMMKKQQQLKQQEFQETQSEKDFKERKDSNCSVMSDVGLLCISGRTSRLSSIGSAASGGSTASHVSGASHLSVGSHLSRSSRSPSPHKMLLETSFCGSKPMHTQSIDVDAAPSLVSHVEKQASRPPSRIRSRSPSPHKMLLETSFCGSKQLQVNGEIQVDKENVEPTRTKKERKKPSTGIVTAAEIVPQIAQKLQPETKPSSTRHKVTTKIEVERVNGETTTKQTKKLVDRIEKENEITAVEDPNVKIIPLHSPKRVPIQRKLINMPKLPDRIPVSKKPTKVISIRDLPDDEIYIPLTGPEIDLEEIIRKASPKPKRKEAEPSPSVTTKDTSEDCIYIPLHSPPKSDKTFPEPSAKVPTVGTQLVRKEKTHVNKKSPCDTSNKAKFGSRQYQVCKDGSIFIPLHSPDDDKSPVTFDEEIRRVEEELERAREAERREREERQQKPVTLDLTDSGSNRSRLSQSFTSNKPELTSGSRTPSPGSSLSRKSSFASLFRRSDIFGSPDSPAGSMVRKKSGTFSNILKEASEGLRERSRSRSKSGDRSSQGSIVRSPSIKKNVFTNLFNKKKPEPRGRHRKDEEPPPPRLDFQFTFNAAADGSQSSEPDYIIIPLRDPSDPPAAVDDDMPETELKQDGEIEIQLVSDNEAPTKEHTPPVEVVEEPTMTREKSPSPQKISKSPAEEFSCLKLSTVMAAYGPPTTPELPEKRVHSSHTSESLTDRKSVESMKVGRMSKSSTREKQELHVEEFKADEAEIKSPKSKTPEGEETVEKQESVESLTVAGSSLQHESSVELEEEVKEEIVTVSADGIRKLKLPPERGDLEEDHERKGLVLQDSFEDELPYVPTTLPQERGRGVPIIPVKQRVAEVKTCPIERPRSITPINPATLEDYVTVKEPKCVSEEEKMKISLPREDSISGRSRSPRKLTPKGKTWFEFAEQGLQSPRDYRKSSLPKTPSPPPPLPPRAVVATPPLVVPQATQPPSAPATSWINFEELPEKRKLPKRITTVPPLRGPTDGASLPEKSGATSVGPVVYSYVNPEECQCECHDHNNAASVQDKDESKRGYFQCNKASKTKEGSEKSVSECENCENGRHFEPECDPEERPLLDTNSDCENDDSSSRRDGDWELVVPGSKLEVDRHSYLSDSSYECTSHEGISTGGMDNSVSSDVPGMKPFAMDLDVHSNRSSIISQEEQSDDIVGNLPP